MRRRKGGLGPTSAERVAPTGTCASPNMCVHVPRLQTGKTSHKGSINDIVPRARRSPGPAGAAGRLICSGALGRTTEKPACPLRPGENELRRGGAGQDVPGRRTLYEPEESPGPLGASAGRRTQSPCRHSALPITPKEEEGTELPMDVCHPLRYPQGSGGTNE